MMIMTMIFFLSSIFLPPPGENCRFSFAAGGGQAEAGPTPAAVDGEAAAASGQTVVRPVDMAAEPGALPEVDKDVRMVSPIEASPPEGEKAAELTA